HECRDISDDAGWRQLRETDGNHAAAHSRIERLVRLLTARFDTRIRVRFFSFKCRSRKFGVAGEIDEFLQLETYPEDRSVGGRIDRDRAGDTGLRERSTVGRGSGHVRKGHRSNLSALLPELSPAWLGRANVADVLRGYPPVGPFDQEPRRQARDAAMDDGQT